MNRPRHHTEIPDGSCRPADKDDRLDSYGDIVRHYKLHVRHKAGRGLRLFAIQKSLAKAVEVAALAKTAAGKRQAHQRRIPAAVLRRSHAALQKVNFSRSSSFDDLMALIEAAIGNIAGVGPLTVYDTARRIGAYLELEPEKVYLHSGTRAGARAIGLGRGLKTLEIDELPAPFHSLTAGEIEDCLCIYTNELGQVFDSIRQRD